MKPVQKLEADRKRHAQAVEAALARTSLLRNQLEGDDGALLTQQQRDEYVQHLLAHHADAHRPAGAAASNTEAAAAASMYAIDAASSWPSLQPGEGEENEGGFGAGAVDWEVAGTAEVGAGVGSAAEAGPEGETPEGVAQQQQKRSYGIVPPTLTLLDRVRLKQLQAKLSDQRKHQAKHEDLTAQAVQLQKEEEAIRTREASKARTNIQVALREDDRLATLPSKQLLRELVRAGHMSSLTLLADDPIHIEQTRPPTRAAGSRNLNRLSTINSSNISRFGETDWDEDTDDDESSGDDDDETEAYGMEETAFTTITRPGRDTVLPMAPDAYTPIRGPLLGVDNPNHPDNPLNPRRLRAQQRAQREQTDQRRTLLERPEQLPIQQADTLGTLLQQYRREQARPQNERQIQLDALLAALKGAMPDQERALHMLRMRHEMGAIRLHWAAHRPASTYGRDSRGMTAKQQALKAMCRSLAYELVDEALAVAMMRPCKADVKRELATWKAKQTTALHDVARHVADGVLKDCVDDIIVEVTKEVMHLSTVADTFATDILVEAVAFSQGKFNFRGDDVRAHLRDAARQLEEKARAAQLRHNHVTYVRELSRNRISLSNRTASIEGDMRFSYQSGDLLLTPKKLAFVPPKATGTSETKSEPDHLQKSVMMMKKRDATFRRTVQVGEAGGTEGGPQQQESAEADLVIGPGNVLVPRRQPQRRIVRFAQGVDDSMDESSMYTVSRLYDDRQPSTTAQGPSAAYGVAAWQQGLARTAAHGLWKKAAGMASRPEPMRLYVKGLKSMLEEMRKRRGAAPFGHTQQLTPRWPAGVKVSRAQRALVARTRPPLAAGPAVYAHRKTSSTRKIKAGLYPSAASYDASELEFIFWSKVTLTPMFYSTVNNVPLTSVAAVDLVMPVITTLAISPSGAFLAVGTANGAMLVFDLRDDPCAPWFAVIGDGEPYKSKASSLPRWLSGRKPAPATPIKALTWSVDSYQLASFDASSTLRVWWMRPEPGQVMEDASGRVPVVPELAITLGPFMVALSGKMPVQDELEEQSLSAAVAQMASGGTAMTEMELLQNQQQLQQRQELARREGRVELGRWGRAVPLAFHPSFNIIGCQPAIVIPQVTGDVLKLVCGYGRNTLRARPTPFAAKPQLLDGATCEFLMPPQVANSSILSQSLFRAHQGHVIFIGFLSDMSTMLSVDHHGVVLLWPSQEINRTGFGWFTPRSTWTMPLTVRTYHARGPPKAMTPPAGPWLKRAGSGRGREEPPSLASTAMSGVDTQGRSKFSLLRLLGMMKGEEKRADQAPHPSHILPAWKSEEEDPLLQHHRPWLVRMAWDNRVGSARKGGQLVRQAIYKPTKRLGQGKPLIISSMALPEGRITARHAQHVVLANLPYQVVAAGMTPSLRDLVIWTRIAAQEADPHSFTFFSAHIVNIEMMRSTVPRIDVYDHSQGSCPPAYAITPVTPAMGTEYMFVGLGCGVVGTYSLATGQLVRELHLGIPLSATHFVSLGLAEVSTAQGDCKNAGKVVLAAIPSSSAHVYLFEVDDEVGTVEALASRHPPPPTPPVKKVKPQVVLQQPAGMAPVPHSRPLPLPPPIPTPPVRQQQQQQQQQLVGFTTEHAVQLQPARPAPMAQQQQHQPQQLHAAQQQRPQHHAGPPLSQQFAGVALPPPPPKQQQQQQQSKQQQAEPQQPPLHLP